MRPNEAKYILMAHYLGIDVGSITTKMVVIDEGDRILAKAYLRNNGRPIEAIQQGMEKILAHMGEGIPIDGVATTGSARQLAAYLVGADLVKNEITAHSIADRSISTLKPGRSLRLEDRIPRSLS